MDRIELGGCGFGSVRFDRTRRRNRVAGGGTKSGGGVAAETAEVISWVWVLFSRSGTMPCCRNKGSSRNRFALRVSLRCLLPVCTSTIATADSFNSMSALLSAPRVLGYPDMEGKTAFRQVCVYGSTLKKQAIESSYIIPKNQKIGIDISNFR